VEILGLGVDICEIARMERALARHPTMRERVFTVEERAYCDRKARPAESSSASIRQADSNSALKFSKSGSVLSDIS